MTVGLLFSLAAALAYGAGSVLQAAGVRASSARGRGVVGAALQPLYLAGLGCDLGAWLLSLVALRRLAVFVVQAVLAGSLAVTVLLAAATIGTSLRREDWVPIGAVIAALAVIGASGGATRSTAPAHLVELGLLAGAFAAPAAVAAACRWASPVVVAAVAGLAFGGGSLAARALPTASHLTGYLHEPLAWAVLGYGAVGMYAYAFALERGDVGVVTATLWVPELVVPGVIGVVFLQDRVRSGWLAPAVVATVVAVVATIALSRTAADQTASIEAPEPATT
jgi:drug/metabolite transporter (DMT)-like permease